MRHSIGRIAAAVIVMSSLVAIDAAAGPVAASSATAPPSGFWMTMSWSKSVYEGFRGSRLGKTPSRRTDGTLSYSAPCTSLDDPRCTVSAVGVTPDFLSQYDEMGGPFGLIWTSLFPYCESTTQMNCITGLTVGDADTAISEQATLLGAETPPHSPTDIDFAPFTGDLSRLIPDGGKSPIFTSQVLTPPTPRSTIPGAPQSRATSFRVRVAMRGQSRQVRCVSAAEKKSAACRRKSDVPDNFIQGFSVKVESVSAQPTPSQPGEYTVMGPVYALPSTAEFTVGIRLSTELLPKGWMNGRVTRPGITQTSIENGYEIVLSGRVAQAPTAAVNFTCDDFPALSPKTKEYFSSVWTQTRAMGNLSKVPVCSTPAAIAETRGGNGAMFRPTISREVLLGQVPGSEDWGIADALETIRAANDSMGVPSTEWSISWMPESVPWNIWSTASPCNATGLIGIVGTSAALYGEFPVFDPTTGQLTYKMVGPHYLADGTLNEGTMSLVMRRDYALCQWGMDPVSGTMAVNVSNLIDNAPNPAVVTTSIEGDFYRADATGITFSAPRLSVTPPKVKVGSTKAIRVKRGSTLAITKVSRSRKGIVSSWYVRKGACKITAANTRVLRMAKKGTCEVVLTEYNKKTRKVSRTLLRVS